MKKGDSQSILTIFLASMLLFGAITITTSSNGNTMIKLQSAEAEETITPTVNQDNTCDEDAGSADSDSCSNSSTITFDSAIQTPDTGGSNLYDAIITHDQLNDCDESGPGDNEAECANTLTSTIMGPIIQTNNPSNNPVGTNEIDIVIDNDQLNDCDETGASGGTNFANCINEGTVEVGGNNGITEGINQFNFAIATDNLDNPNFSEDNTIDTFQRLDMFNTCDEMQVSPASTNVCANDAENFIGPVEQSNTVIAEIPEQPHTNSFAASQIVIAQNDCDETGSGASIDLACENGDSFVSNEINSVLQENEATNTDNAVQTNDASSVQSLDLENDCNESEDGDNTAECDTDEENFVESLHQRNSALGHQDATIFQNNEIDGDDASDIPGISQVITADNTCDEIGVGTNDAECNIEFLNNIIAPLGVQNVVNEADSATDIFQDNRLAISQVIDAENDCDETGIGGGFNDAQCTIDQAVDNFLGISGGSNFATGNDNSLFDQDNNIDVSQNIVADNDCNASGNAAFCLNRGSVQNNRMNSIDNIPQESFSDLTGDAFSNQLNEASIDQNAATLNTCDESGTGLNNAQCVNEIQNFVGPIGQSNDATGADNAVISETSNKVDIVQNIQATNDCDESDAGFGNVAICDNKAFNDIQSVSQSNTATGVGADDIDQDNFVSINQNLQARNDCDESGDGSNSGDCFNTASNNIGSILQTNTATGDGDDTVDQDNILAINQDLVTTNDCDEFGLGDNEVECSIDISNEIGNIEQTNTDSNTGSANSLIINQDLEARNNCDDSTSGDNTKTCTIDLHLVVPDLTQTDGEVLTINLNDFALNTCPGGGTCTISRTTTFDPNNPDDPIITALAAPSFSLTSLEKNTNEEDTQTTTGTTASFTAASTETQITTVNDDNNQGNDDNSNTNDNNNNNNNIDDTSSKLSSAETETSNTVSEEAEQQDEEQDGAPEGAEEGDDTGNDNQNNNNNDNNDDDSNGDGNDNDDNQNNTNNNDNNDNEEREEGGEQDEEDDEEEEDEDEEDDEPEEGGDEGEDGE